MTSSSKKRRTNNGVGEPGPSRSNRNSQKLDTPQNGERAHGKKPASFIKPEVVSMNGDNDERQENNTDDNISLRDYVRQLLDMEASTVKLTDNGSILVRPQPHLMPSGLALLLVQHIHGRRALFNFALINKQCYAAANPFLWKSLKIQSRPALEHLLLLLPHSRQSLGLYIHELDISQVTCSNDDFCLLLRHIYFLKKLKMTNMTWGPLANTPMTTTTTTTNMSSRRFSIRCRKLTSLTLTGCDISQPIIQSIACRCLKLEKLTLRDCPNVSSDTFQAFMDCPVKRLRITSTSVNVPEKADLALILTQFHLLKRLAIDFRDHGFVRHLMITPPPSTTEAAAETSTIINTTTTTAMDKPPPVPWPQLTHLMVGNCHHIGDQTLKTFVKSHPRLRTLCLTGFSQFGNPSMYTIGSHLPRLTYFSVMNNHRITDSGARCLVIRSDRLVYAEFIDCDQLLKRVNALPNYFHHDQHKVTFGEKKAVRL
ncbi:hypothetical protein BCR42DRAFT_472464 [Absidia repens]|uniref:F-box domain-containing protein n=1 Tax=Absidia repens TaxID=90262 RepID=A0A1X2I1A0_9FUNG|nr:hypothetical protein BCR42DRAFT_472464 [Absidia repens]